MARFETVNIVGHESYRQCPHVYFLLSLSVLMAIFQVDLSS